MKDEYIKVLVIEPRMEPKVEVVKNELETFQDLVGGYIQAVPAGGAYSGVLICNEEGKLMHLPVNRYLFDTECEPCDVLNGTIVICGIGNGEFTSLSFKEQAYYKWLYGKEL